MYSIKNNLFVKIKQIYLINSNIFMDNSQILPYKIGQKLNSSSIIVNFCKNDHFL